jgi:hypothetical protein
MKDQIKVSHTLSPETIKRIDREAKRSRRSRSGMIDVLLSEALENRHGQSSGRSVAPCSCGTPSQE